MTGPKKLAAIREELRAAFAAAGANPIPALDRKIRKLSKNSKAGEKELPSLGLLRNALAQVIEDNPPKPLRSPRAKRTKGSPPLLLINLVLAARSDQEPGDG